MNPALMVDPVMKGAMATTVASTIAGGATTTATNVKEIESGKVQLELKEVDLSTQLPGRVNIPQIQRP